MTEIKTAEEKNVPIGIVQGWKKNPKTMVKKADFERLKNQILELGLYKRLVCCRENEKYIVLGGNQRLRALQDLGAQQVAISIVKAPTDADKLKYALSDNDNVAGWDDQGLAELLYGAKDKINTELFKIELGKPISIENLLNQFGPGFEQSPEDRVPDPETKSDVRPGDLFTAGPHRILCGDATQPWAYEALLEGKKADLVFTDPPYNVKYEGTKYGPIAGDNLSEEKFVEFTLAFLTRMKENTKAGGVFYICSGYSSYPVFIYGIKAVGMTFSTPIIWIKNAASLGWSDYHHKHEMVLKAQQSKRKTAVPILYGWKGGKHYFLDIRSEADVWEISKRASSTMLHPTQNPLAMIQRAIRNSSRPGELVLDPFGGSGSTMIAAEREGRKAATIELDPIYIDVMIRRYAALGAATEAEIRRTRKQTAIPRKVKK
jgi:DNA modification methylase